MLNVKILKSEPRLIEWSAKPGRDAGSMRTQEAWAFVVDREGKAAPYPDKFEVVLDRATATRPEQPAYPVGDYTLHPSALYVDKNGRLAVAARLTPVRPAAPAPAAR